MADIKLSRAATMAVVVGAGASLALVGCSSNSGSSSDPSTSPASPTATGTAPSTAINPPSGSKQITNESVGGATYTRYSTSKTPKEVVTFYDGEFKSANFTITSEGGGGGGWGKYGGSDAGISANNGSNFMAVHAGGQSGGTTFFEVCAGPSSQSVEKCQQSNHSSSNQS